MDTAPTSLNITCYTIHITCGEAHQFFFLAENERFTEFEFTTGNDLETSEILLSVLFCIIEKNAFS